MKPKLGAESPVGPAGPDVIVVSGGCAALAAAGARAIVARAVATIVLSGFMPRF
jgi:hypothetical protein